MKAVVVAVLALALTACGPGEQGEQGPTGPPGPQGAAGPGVASVKMYACDGFFPLSSPDSGAYVNHDVYVFADGGVMTSCQIEGSVHMSTGFNMLRPTDPGAPLAYCNAMMDFDVGSGGYWEFETTSDRKTSRVRYVDPGSTYSNRVVSIPCSPY